MSFDPMDLELYRKAPPPFDERSRVEYLDQQLRNIERSINHLVTAVEQLQAELTLTNADVDALQAPGIFAAWQTSGQSIPHATSTKLNYHSSGPSDGFNTSTDKYTPTVAGYYLVGGDLTFNSIVGSNNALELYKNGAFYAKIAQGALYTSSGSLLVYANGTTDYYEMYAYQSTGGSINTSSATFWGYFVRSA